MKKAINENNIKLALICILLLSALAVAWAKSAFLQFSHGRELGDVAENQSSRYIVKTGKRGNIFDRNGKLLASSVLADSIYAQPKKMHDQKKTFDTLKSNLGKEFHSKLTEQWAKRNFVWIARRIGANTAAQITSLNLDGVGVKKESKRFYPNHSTLGQTLGLVSIDGKGLSGIELAYDQFLLPRKNKDKITVDAIGRPIKLSTSARSTYLDGHDIYLTIDQQIQQRTEEILWQAIDKHRAKSAWAVVMNAQSGEILALATVPSPNPNQPKSSPPSSFRNTAISGLHEPGSVFKIVTFAAAVEEEVITPQSKIYCEKGIFKIGKHTIRDVSPRGWLEVSDIFKYSSNIGTIKIAKKLGPKRLEKIIRQLGFGKTPGLQLLGEASGQPIESSKWSKIRMANISFGYGITASTLQMAVAVGTVANGGVFLRPRIISRIVSPQNATYFGQASVEQRSLKPQTAKILTKMMVGSTNGDGTGVRARIKGVQVAGKTGTAEKVNPKTGIYDPLLNQASFAGFAPADSPKIVAALVIDEPMGIGYGGGCCGSCLAKNR